MVETLWGTPKDIFGKTAFISPLCYSPSSSYVEAKIPASEYSYYLYRRNALSRWFSDTSSSAAEADLQKIPEDADTEEAKQCYIMFQVFLRLFRFA